MKYFFLTITAIFCIAFIACNEGEVKKGHEEKTDTTNLARQAACPGNWNITLTKSEAEGMILRYRNDYNKQNLSDSAWIDALVIRSFGAFLESKEGIKFDGARFYHGAPSGNNETILMMVPTKPKNDTLHINQWGVVFSLLENDQIKYTHYNLPVSDSTDKVTRFESDFRENGSVKALSKSIWMNRCVFTELYRLIDSSLKTSDPITGISVLYGTYDKFVPEVRGQNYKNQSTIILVPTSSDGVGGHSNRWDIIQSKIKKLDNAGYNHGELCPQKCE